VPNIAVGLIDHFPPYAVTLEFSACHSSLCNQMPVDQQHGGGGPAQQVVFCHQVSGEEIKEDYVHLQVHTI